MVVNRAQTVLYLTRLSILPMVFLRVRENYRPREIAKDWRHFRLTRFDVKKWPIFVFQKLTLVLLYQNADCDSFSYF